MNIQKRINALRSAMIQKGIDIYIIPTADFHHSEYVGDYFKFREYMTGFTGSAGTAVFTSKKAGLWTDGRYFIQAEQQLAGSGIDLYRFSVLTEELSAMKKERPTVSSQSRSMHL